METAKDREPMAGDGASTSDLLDESGAPPRRRRRSHRKGGSACSISEDNRMSVSDNVTAEAPIEVGDKRGMLESDGGYENTDDDADVEDHEENSASEADALDYDTYYSFNEDLDVGVDRVGLDEGSSGNIFNNNDDPEYFAYECLTVEKAEKLLQDQIALVCSVTKVSPSEGRLLLHLNRWTTSEVIKNAPTNSSPATLPSSALTHPPRLLHPFKSAETFLFCDVCAVTQTGSDFSHLSCNHLFCKNCWENHFGHQILQGLSTSLSCMSSKCDTRAHEDFVMAHVMKETVRERYKQLAFLECIRSHPQLRFCPGNNCKYVIKAEKCVHKRATCMGCKTSFCYQCGGDYHAPTDCETIKRWLTKCADDSETANYISAHTKDCPKCNICIEKNGGCNHMQCYNCKHDFCWMCLGDWRTHGSEYYECSRYKENPNIAHESAHAQAREALKKYLHYFERWENHSNSMKLEAQTLAKIKTRINEKVMNSCGTWIDWQYLLDAASLLAKCRYTLQYTYPYAYYMESSNRKKLFECQQAQLEAEIENLSWKIEHAEITDRGDLENQIDVAEKRRTSLLKDFLPS